MNNELDNNFDKKLIITGINTKYQMKKVLGVKQKEPKQRSIWVTPTEDDLFIPTNQLTAIEDIHNTNPIYLKEITKKINGYKNQDALKNRLIEGTFITVQQTVEKLNECKLTCYYCHCFTHILYKNARDGSQWSLDRIDNDVGHTQLNVVVSCLKCNLQKKRISTNTFLMSKQMIITRVE